MPGSEERHKMTKWDNADDFHHYGEASRSSLEAAAEAAAKVNAMLIAKGKLKPSQLSNVQQTKQKASQAQTSMEMAEVEINDVPISCRNLLTRGSTQDEISKMSGAAVSTRGRFMSPEDRVHSGPGDRPLYLCVQGPAKDCVDKAVARIREIIANSYRNKNAKYSGPRPPGVTAPMGLRARMPVVDGPGIIPTPPPLMSLNTQPPGLPLLQEKLFIGLEHAPPSFDVKNKILGPMGTYLQHIQTESGAKVMLHGKGSGFIEPTTGREAFEPMHILIQHPTALGLQQAKQLSENLVQTVQQDYAQFQQALVDMSPNFTPGQPAPLLTGIQPQPGLPLSGTTWSLAQPPPGMPSASVATALPGAAVQAIAHHPPHVTVSMSGPQPVGEVLGGAYNQSVQQNTRSIPQTVLINTSVPPPNFVPQPQTSTHSLHIGTSMALAQSQPPGTVVQPMYSSGLASSQAPPPGIQAPAMGVQAPLPGATGAAITSLTPPAQTNIVQVTGLPPQPGGGMMTQTILTQQPAPPQADTSAVVQHIPQIAGPPQVVVSLPPPHNLHQQPLPNMSQPPPNLSQPPPNLSQPPPNLSQPPPNLQQPQPLPNLSQPPPNMSQPPPDMSQAIANMSQPPPTLTQGPPHKAQPQSTVVTTVTGPNGHTYYKQYVQTGTSTVEIERAVSTSGPAPHKDDRPPHKRRFTEEKKEEKLPGNLLGYQHGPPHLANIVSSTSLAETATSQPYVVVSQHSGHTSRVETDRTLMPPPAPPLGKLTTHEKQQLMPPPLPPFSLLGNEGPLPKKAKGALGNVSAKDDEDKQEVVGQNFSVAGSLADESKKYTAVGPSFSPAVSAATAELSGPTSISVNMPLYTANTSLDIQGSSRLDPAGQSLRTSQYLASSAPASAAAVIASPHSVISSSMPGTVTNLIQPPQQQQYVSSATLSTQSQLSVPPSGQPPPPPPAPPATSTPYQEVIHSSAPYTELSHTPYATQEVQSTVQPAYVTGIMTGQSTEQRRRVSYWS